MQALQRVVAHAYEQYNNFDANCDWSQFGDVTTLIELVAHSAALDSYHTNILRIADSLLDGIRDMLDNERYALIVPTEHEKLLILFNITIIYRNGNMSCVAPCGVNWLIDSNTSESILGEKWMFDHDTRDRLTDAVSITLNTNADVFEKYEARLVCNYGIDICLQLMDSLYTKPPMFDNECTSSTLELTVDYLREYYVIVKRRQNQSIPVYASCTSKLA